MKCVNCVIMCKIMFHKNCSDSHFVGRCPSLDHMSFKERGEVDRWCVWNIMLDTFYVLTNRDQLCDGDFMCFEHVWSIAQTGNECVVCLNVCAQQEYLWKIGVAQNCNGACGLEKFIAHVERSKIHKPHCKETCINELLTRDDPYTGLMKWTEQSFCINSSISRTAKLSLTN